MKLFGGKQIEWKGKDTYKDKRKGKWKRKAGIIKDRVRKRERDAGLCTYIFTFQCVVYTVPCAVCMSLCKGGYICS